MSSRSFLRTTLLGLVAAGAVLAPAAAAVADDSPTPATDRQATSSPAPRSTPTQVPSAAVTEADTTRPMPRGGVAAGERPVADTGSATALYGSAAGAVLLAGAGTIVLRRRSALHGNG
ncbi:LPXTG cell wall anchor domain-containing protein [Streptomyces griseus]|uniref:LPXTG cell wall anchor domain-containing protein n=1 Tax=Streptomyces griseus TaxID=1911 RepID=UPI0008408316|nr:LPXTG cell wall anchor domain-containing protein [Streptomyces griseus]